MDYFKLAEEELNKVSYSVNYTELDMVRIAKAEVYAKLAHSKVLLESQVLREITNA